MKIISFTEATPLIDYIEKYREEIVGHTLKHLFINYWPGKNGASSSDEPVILELDSICLLIEYLVLSNLTIKIGSLEEIKNEDGAEKIITIRDHIINYFEFCDDVKREDIEGQVITDITVDRFSHSFEYNIQGDEHPDGGDYFSTIRVSLKNGLTLCMRGDDAICDGYICYWCE